MLRNLALRFVAASAGGSYLLTNGADYLLIAGADRLLLA